MFLLCLSSLLFSSVQDGVYAACPVSQKFPPTCLTDRSIMIIINIYIHTSGLLDTLLFIMNDKSTVQYVCLFLTLQTHKHKTDRQSETLFGGLLDIVLLFITKDKTTVLYFFLFLTSRQIKLTDNRQLYLVGSPTVYRAHRPCGHFCALIPL